MLIFRRTTWNGFRFGFWCRVLHVLAHNLKYRDNWESEINHDGTAPTRNRCRNRPSVKPVVGEAGAPTVDLHPVDHGAPSLLPEHQACCRLCRSTWEHALPRLSSTCCLTWVCRAARSGVPGPPLVLYAYQGCSECGWTDWCYSCLLSIHQPK